MGNPYERECGAKEREMQAKGLAGADFTRGISSLSFHVVSACFQRTMLASELDQKRRVRLLSCKRICSDPNKMGLTKSLLGEACVPARRVHIYLAASTKVRLSAARANETASLRHPSVSPPSLPNIASEIAVT